MLSVACRCSPEVRAGLPIVAGDASLDHLVAPVVACHDESGQVATAEAQRGERRHDDEFRRAAPSSRIKPTPARHDPRFLIGQVSLADDPDKPVAPYPKIPYESFRRQRKLWTRNQNDSLALFD